MSKIERICSECARSIHITVGEWPLRGKRRPAHRPTPSDLVPPRSQYGLTWCRRRIGSLASPVGLPQAAMLSEFGASSKLNAEWEFFSLLRDEGRRSAQVFLENHASGLGRRSTLDLDVLLEQI